MIKRELYMSRIRPFIGTELIKVMTGIRRCGKSVMLELIKQELTESGVSPTQFVSINFEDMSYTHLQTARSLNSGIQRLTAQIFLDEIIIIFVNFQIVDDRDSRMAQPLQKRCFLNETALCPPDTLNRSLFIKPQMPG